MSHVSAISHKFKFGAEGKGQKEFEISNYGISKANWQIQEIRPNGTAKIIAFVELNTESGIKLTPHKSGAISIPTLQKSVSDISCHNLPSVANEDPVNQGSVLLAVCFQVFNTLKPKEGGARINSGCERQDANKENWRDAYLHLETLFNFPLYFRSQFVEIMRENNVFIEFPHLPITDHPPVETPMERAKKCASLDEMERISKADLQTIALNLEVDSNGSKADLIKRVFSALNPVAA